MTGKVKYNYKIPSNVSFYDVFVSHTDILTCHTLTFFDAFVLFIFIINLISVILLGGGGNVRFKGGF